MTIDEINEFIKNYLDSENYQGAIMLKAPWGTGKSYYVNNDLLQFLRNNGNYQSIIISLYGAKETSEISKSIFIEAKFKGIKNNCFEVNSGKLIAKTIIKGVTSFFGINIGISEQDLQKIYSSIDLSNKLIILEDIERSQINIIEILGFVNDLVENKAKVLLVVNEDELLHYKLDVRGKATETQRKLFDDQTIKYLNTKEKTISDTIVFNCSIEEAIKNIIKQFNNDILNNVIDHSLSEILYIMDKKKNYNLRSFIYGCQKTIEIFKNIDFELDLDFIKNVFFSNIAFSLRKKQCDNLNWNTHGNTSEELGIFRYPLYKFSYDYFSKHHLDIEELKKCHDDYVAYKIRTEAKQELLPYLDIIYSYYIKKETEIIDAVNFVLKKLKETDDISFEEYTKLANYLIAIKYDLELNEEIDACKKAMISKAKKSFNREIDKISFYNGISLESEAAVMEFNRFKNELNNATNQSDLYLNYFNFSNGDIDDFCKYVHKNKDLFLKNRRFFSDVNNGYLVNLLKESSAKEIQDLRSALLFVYQTPDCNDCFADDIESLKEFKRSIEELRTEKILFDKIQIKQINYLINNLDDIIISFE